MSRSVAVGWRVRPRAWVRTHARRRRGARGWARRPWRPRRTRRALGRRRLRGRRSAAGRGALRPGWSGRPRGRTVVRTLAGDVVAGAAHHVGGRALAHAGTAPALVTKLRMRHMVGQRPAGVRVALRPTGARTVVLIRTVLHVSLRPGTVAASCNKHRRLGSRFPGGSRIHNATP